MARAPFAMATGSRAQMLAIPVATMIRRPPASRSDAWVKASLLPRPSGIHSAG
jgi:hypothetical protein